MMILFFYFSFFLQYLVSNFIYISLTIGTLVLFDQIFKKKDNLFKIFLILLPTLSPLTLNDETINNTIIIFNINISLILVAGFFYFVRNCIFIKLNKVNYILFLYLILFVFALMHLFYVYFDNQQHNQGLTYAFRAILYICPLFIVYNNHYSEFKKQILQIVKLSIFLLIFRILLDNFTYVKITGHLIFLAASFPAFILAYKTNFRNLSYYLLFIFLLFSQSFTLIGIGLLSSLLVFFRKFSFIFNKVNFFILINFQILVAFTASNLHLDFFEMFNLDTYFFKKLMLDRYPLIISSVQSLEIFQFQLKPLLIEIPNIITTREGTWESGAHNYFLTMATKLGVLPVLIMFLIINFYLFGLNNKIRSKFNLKDKNNFLFLLFVTLISSYAVFSTTGNAYAEITGLLFFLLLGSLNSVVNSNRR